MKHTCNIIGPASPSTFRTFHLLRLKLTFHPTPTPVPATPSQFLPLPLLSLRGSLCSLGWPGTHYIAQGGLGHSAIFSQALQWWMLECDLWLSSLEFTLGESLGIGLAALIPKGGFAGETTIAASTGGLHLRFLRPPCRLLWS